MKLDLKKNNNKKYYIQKWTAVESVESEASSRLEIASPCFRDEACPNLPHFISAKFKESASRDMIHLRLRTYKSDVLDLWWCNDARKFKWYDGDLIWYFFFVSRSSQTKALISSFLHVLLDEVCLSFKPQPPRRIWEKREAMFVGLIKLNSHVIRLMTNICLLYYAACSMCCWIRPWEPRIEWNDGIRHIVTRVRNISGTVRNCTRRRPTEQKSKTGAHKPISGVFFFFFFS